MVSNVYIYTYIQKKGDFFIQFNLYQIIIIIYLKEILAHKHLTVKIKQIKPAGFFSKIKKNAEITDYHNYNNTLILYNT